MYRDTKVGNQGKNIEDLSINGNDYSNVHPVLEPDEKRLYFSSNMPSSLGQTDLFSATINADATLGSPVNLDKKINTKGRESFPYITKENELYLSSEGHFGLGGYDIFFIDLKTTEMQLLNVGAPVNSPADDFAFYWTLKLKKVFLVQIGNKWAIYTVLQKQNQLEELLKAILIGVVTDKATGKPIKKRKHR